MTTSNASPPGADDPSVPRIGVERLGQQWVRGALPGAAEWWSRAAEKSRRIDGEAYDAEPALVRAYLEGRTWRWSGKRVVFVCDIHADADAWFTSLVSSGSVEKLGEADDDFRLTEAGQHTEFILGGDCFDKGPDNLRLLRAIGSLKRAGGEVTILAGNHDLRTIVGLSYMGRKEPRYAHLFVRMGKKSIPLFREVWRDYLDGEVREADYPSNAELETMLMPDETWYGDFLEEMTGRIPQPKLLKELVRIREKISELKAKCIELQLPLWKVYAAALKARELFGPHGEFGWFFSEMQLARRHGVCLFIHAGLGDATAAILRRSGVEGLNEEFQRLVGTDLFDLYHGPIGNTFRTKYRDIDFPLTGAGVADIHGAGVHAIVHGHRNIHHGQRLVMRCGILNFECDASVDINTRRLEGMEGFGGAATVFEPDGRVWATSTDHPTIKVFDPSRHTEVEIAAE